MVQQLLLLGQLVFVALIYLFVWRVVRGARGDLLGAAGARRSMASQDAQESTIIPAADAHAARRAAGLTEPRLVVHSSEVLRPGVPFTIGGGLTIGRGETNDIVLDDAVVSSRHLRIVPPGTVVDDGSTNGTFVNGQRVKDRATLRPGDQLQAGSTVFIYEGAR
ncbi:MAG: domain containing protein [Thermoleophilia bacterium]|nr:domain containing protein [Thermoleophilia bacterium]